MPKQYTVRPGDTLIQIAKRECNGQITAHQIAADNNISNPNLIFVGDVLTLNCDEADRAPGQKLYVVQPGDTLSAIASRECGGTISWQQIAADNPTGVTNPDQIHPGDVLVLKCATDPGRGGGHTPAPNTDLYAPPWRNPTGQTLDGIDASHWQGNVNWTAVKNAGKQFAYIKATEGTHFTDSRFAHNWLQAKSAGVVRGAYHYFRALQPAMAQVDHYMNTVGMLEENDLPPALDVERTNNRSASRNQFIDGLNIWLTEIQGRTGRIPVIYTSQSAWQELVNSDNFGHYPLWVANFVPNPAITTPAMPRGWESYVIWQVSETGQVNGVSGNVDLDVFNGSREDLITFLKLTNTAL